MNSPITAAVVTDHIAELRRAADHRRAAQVIALRVARPEDDYDVSRLAQLDEAQLPVGPVMLGVVDGEAVAALSLTDGHVVADPFVATEKVVSLLRVRATQLSGQRRHRWMPRILRPRLG
jgi:hypothetical protein